MSPSEKDMALGIDLGATAIKAAVCRADGHMFEPVGVESRADAGAEITVAQMADAGRMAAERAGVALSSLKAAGVGAPGVHDTSRGVCLWSPNFKDGWKNVPLAQMLSEELGIPVTLENDVNAAAWGEYCAGAGRGSSCMGMLTLGTGIGGGLVFDGKLWRGASGSAGEIGHSVILPGGPDCACGKRGCLEALAGRDAICARARARYAEADISLREDVTPAFLAEEAARGVEPALKTFEQVGRYVGIAVANLVNIFNPERVVIGGGIAGAGDVILGPIRRSAETESLPQSFAACSIVPAELGNRAGILGSALLAVART